MAQKKLKEIAEGCTLSFPVKDLKSDRKNIRIFITSPDNGHCIVQCDEEISNRLRNNEIKMSQLIECYYNSKDKMITLVEAKEDETIDSPLISLEDIW